MHPLMLFLALFGGLLAVSALAAVGLWIGNRAFDWLWRKGGERAVAVASVVVFCAVFAAVFTISTAFLR